MPKNKLEQIYQQCLKDLLFLYKNAKAGHIGASLSCLKILIYLYFRQMAKADKFILSKGHAAAGLYIVLAQAGIISQKDLATYYADGTLLAAHPPCSGKLKGVIFGTGSLGHGLSLAVGLALASKFTKKKYQVYCLLSEGDCNEGSTWEAALFAAQHHLSNLTVIIDNNGLQGFGKSKEVLNLEPFMKKWQAFNFEVIEAQNGNDFKCLDKAFKKLEAIKKDMPKCIIAKTTKGSGVSYMENKLEWHYLPMTDEQYEIALKELES